MNVNIRIIISQLFSFQKRKKGSSILSSSISVSIFPMFPHLHCIAYELKPTNKKRTGVCDAYPLAPSTLNHQGESDVIPRAAP